MMERRSAAARGEKGDRRVLGGGKKDAPNCWDGAGTGQ
jgi:hypothetical protein